MSDKDEFCFVPGGWPAWEQQALEILSSIRAHVFEPSAIGIVALGQAVVLRGDKANSDVALGGFLRILDIFLSQLIAWAEQTEPPNRELRRWAGKALAERLLFLSAQSDHWRETNEGFKKRRAEFGDRRRARSPGSYLGWLAGDYLDKLIGERRIAEVVLSPLRALDGSSFAQLLGFGEDRVLRLKELCALPDFSPDSAREWADLVFSAMNEDEKEILKAVEIRKSKPRADIADRRSETRFIVRSGKLYAKDNKHCGREGKVRLHDFQSTIVRAVMRLARKPSRRVRGITRPG